MSPQPRDYPGDTDPNYRQHWHGDAVSGTGRTGGKDRRIDMWIQGAVLAGILALVGIVWTLREEVTKITTFVSIKAEQYDRDIQRIERTLDGHNQRIADIERGKSPRQPDADYRQER